MSQYHRASLGNPVDLVLTHHKAPGLENALEPIAVGNTLRPRARNGATKYLSLGSDGEEIEVVRVALKQGAKEGLTLLFVPAVHLRDRT